MDRDVPRLVVEQVVLELLDRAAREWLVELYDRFSRPGNENPVDRVADALAGSLTGRPPLCELISVTAGILERNISTDIARRFKLGTAELALLLATLSTMLPNFFLTGFAFPRSNMPPFLQVISWPLPGTQFLIAIRGVFLKGVGWEVLWPQGLWMAITAAFLVFQAVRIMRRTLARGLEQ